MRRRELLATGVLVGTAGCTRRVTGWSQLTLRLRNNRDQRVTVRVVARVDGERRYRASFTLDADTGQKTRMPFTADWGATLTFRATVPEDGESTTVDWPARVPTWGGNECMIEPFVAVTEEDVVIGPSCVA